jgi:hypothetical protein
MINNRFNVVYHLLGFVINLFYLCNMKSYIVNLEGKSGIRSISELNTMLNYMIENENYELCSLIKEVIDNYDELVNKMKTN